MTYLVAYSKLDFDAIDFNAYAADQSWMRFFDPHLSWFGNPYLDPFGLVYATRFSYRTRDAKGQARFDLAGDDLAVDGAGRLAGGVVGALGTYRRTGGSFAPQFEAWGGAVAAADVAAATASSRVGDDRAVLATFFGGNDDMLGSGGADRLYGYDGLDELYGRAGNDRLDGGAGNDWLQGDAGRDRLRGGAGSDSLFGGAQGDRLSGGGGDDVLSLDGGNDRILGGPGLDVLVPAGGGGGLSVDLGRDGPQDTGYGRDTISGVEAVIGSPYGDIVYGNDNRNVIVGGGGVDFIHGLGGNDWIDGGGRGDEISGGAGDDVLHGGAGGDALDGGPGDDILEGGPGPDELLGGDGADRFVFLRPEDSLGLGRDKVGDFDLGHDVMVLDFMPAGTPFGGQTPTANGVWWVDDEVVGIVLMADTDGDATPDFEVWFPGTREFRAGDLAFAGGAPPPDPGADWDPDTLAGGYWP